MWIVWLEYFQQAMIGGLFIYSAYVILIKGYFWVIAAMNKKKG